MSLYLTKTNIHALTLISATMVLQACSSPITSEHLTLTDCQGANNLCEKLKYNNGLIYHMPKRDIRINVSITDAPPTPPAAEKTTTGAPACASNATYCHTTQVKQTTHEKQVIGKKTVNTITTSITNTLSNNNLDPAVIAAQEAGVKIVTVSLSNNIASETVPDLSDTYILHYKKNWFAQNDVAIGINNFGLLSVTHGDAINKTDLIASNIAQDVASVYMKAGFLAKNTTTSPDDVSTFVPFSPGTLIPSSDNSVSFKLTAKDIGDCVNGNYTISIDPANDLDQNKNICGIQIKVTSLTNIHLKNVIVDPGFFNHFIYDLKSSNSFNGNELLQGVLFYLKRLSPFHEQYSHNSYSGLYYRQDLPYSVEVKKITTVPRAAIDQVAPTAQPISKFLAMSPNESPTYFAPIDKTFFASNASDINLSNGVITALKDSTDSELYALTKIPADVLGSYTSALGELFKAMDTKVSLENSYNQDKNNPATQAQIQKCLTALAQYPTTGLSGQALSNAQAFITAACSAN